MNSFFPDAIVSWNIFGKHFDDVPSLNIFQDYSNTFFRPKLKSILSAHDPLGLRYPFQLRVSLSPLRRHKRRPNIIYTPSDGH